MRRGPIISSLLAALCISLVSAAAAQRSNPNVFGDDKVRLIVRADDFGFVGDGEFLFYGGSVEAFH